MSIKKCNVIMLRIIYVEHTSANGSAGHHH